MRKKAPSPIEPGVGPFFVSMFHSGRILGMNERLCVDFYKELLILPPFS